MGQPLRCYEPDAARFGRIALGMPYVEFDVPAGSADGIAAFYRAMVDTPADVVNGDGRAARVQIGKDQHLFFRETDRAAAGLRRPSHRRSTSTNFSGPHGRLRERNLVSQEDNQYQYRFRDIVDLDSGRHLFTIEHEVRTRRTRCSCGRWSTAIRRRPTATTRAGYEQAPWAMEPDLYDPPCRDALTVSGRGAQHRFTAPRTANCTAGRTARRPVTVCTGLR